MSSKNPTFLSAANIDNAASKISDAIRLINICAVALDQEGLEDDVQETLRKESTSTLWDALEDLGFDPRGKLMFAKTEKEEAA